MDFTLPEDLRDYLAELDEFIEREIRPLELEGDNIRFFDHRREDARTDWDRGGLPSREWEALLAEARRRADAAGHFRYAFPKEYGGRDGTNLGMAVIREHLARKGLGLHCDLQNEHAIVGNNVGLLLMLHYGSPEQKAEWVDDLAAGRRHFAFGITEPAHGSDATFMETRATKRRRRTGSSTARRPGTPASTPPRTTWSSPAPAGRRAAARASPGFLVPVDTPGFKVEEYLWTFNMPTDHAHVSFTGVRVPDSAILGTEGRGLQIVQHFFNENRIRQAASSLGAAQFCIDRSVEYARARKPFGKPLASNQAIQFPLVELQTQGEMLRALIHKTAWSMDTYGPLTQSDKVSMCNYVANRLCCEAADRAMQVHGGLGYSRHRPFEHIYRHHRRYRITEGAEEIQMRRVAGYLFGFIKPDTLKGVTRPLISATVALAAFTRSAGASSISRPRRPALQNTVPNPIAEESSTTGSRLRWPTGEMPPATYPVARSAAVTWAIAAFLPPHAAASAFRSSWAPTGTTPVTRAPSTSATSVLNTRSGETPSASLASAP